MASKRDFYSINCWISERVMLVELAPGLELDALDDGVSTLAAIGGGRPWRIKQRSCPSFLQ